MDMFYPTMYKKSIDKINYQKLKEKGISVLIFDLDNTIALIDQEKIDDKTKKLIKELKKDFKIVLISNNTVERVEPFAKMLDCDFYANSLKPLGKSYRKIMKKYKITKDKMAMIGDQLVTDIFVGNRMTACSVLVDPLGKKDLKITSFNRFLERKIFKYFEKKHVMKKGEYYE